MKFDLIKFNIFLKKRVFVLFSIFVFINVFANLPSLNIFVDILSHFKVQYLYISILFSVVFLYFSFFYRKCIFALIISIFLIFVNGLEVSSYCMQPLRMTKTVKNVENNIKLGLFNVLTSNNNYNKLLFEIKLKNPDIIILQEVDENWLNNISNLKDDYPYFVEYPREDNFGMSFYSKYPITKSAVEFWTYHEVPVIFAKVKKGKNEIAFYCVHTLPPVNTEYITVRNKMLQNINKILNNARKNEDNVIIAGDFNTTIFSPAYKKYIDSPLNSKVVYDAIRYMSKIQGSWNAYHPPVFRVTLEHVLSIPPVIPLETELGNHIGSDHFPIFAEFIIAAEGG